MRACPFCGYNEGWIKETTYQKPIRYRVECKVCGAIGPEAKTHEMAEDKWDGILMDTEDEKEFKEVLKEDTMGGVSSPMTTLTNTPGMGNAVPGSSSTNNIGSGDKWGNTIGGKPYTQKAKVKRKKKPIKKKLVKEDNINPYDRIATSMAKKMDVKLPFKKKLGKSKTGEVIQKTFEHEIISLDEYLKNKK